ncbi:nonsense-mediated mRNA decay factor SMG8 [Drosophila montana]|uniref:nonsense-mediated mRNA decay factor SMG8 n=1 Tax=Drosophila montana TaxID=40370 RepID=UPI00313E814A
MSYKNYYTWKYPDIPENVAPLLSELQNSLVIVGIIGRSKCAQANKMSAFGMQPDKTHEPADGQILCYYKPGTNMLLLHFETTHDEAVLGQQLLKQTSVDFDSFYEQMRSRFLRILLLALHVCHILVYVETAQTFDTTLVTICQLLKYVREKHVLDFLPQMLRETAAGSLLRDRARLCTPRVLFLFENYPQDEVKTRERISAYEFQTEDKIYELLRQYNIVTNNANNSLLALPNNKQFVFYNAHEKLRSDQLLLAIEALNATMYKSDVKEEEEDTEILELAPFEGFVKPYGAAYEARESDEQLYRKKHTVWHFLQRHVQDALQGCFDEGSFKQLPQSAQFQLLSANDWHICMDTVHKLLLGHIQEGSYVTNNQNYKAYLRDFNESLNYEKKFWGHLCDLGLKKGISAYKNSVPAIYGSATHKQLLADAILAFEEEGRGPYAELALAKLSDICLRHWLDGRQQCEQLSLRGNPCTQPKDAPHDKHISGIVHISSCNCGRTQGRREDPFTLRQANYNYYEHMAAMCNLCVKVKKFQLPVFTPSISDYRAAAFEAAFPLLLQAAKIRTEIAAQGDSDLDAADELYSQPISATEQAPQKPQITLSNGCSQPALSATYGSDLNMSIAGFGASLNEGEEVRSPEISSQICSSGLSSRSNSTSSGTSSANTANELVLQLKERTDQNAANAAVSEICPEALPMVASTEQVSTTEYLPGLVHMSSGCELLPLFPSWSLACVGPSSIYSHNTGLQEHFQSGFLSGANFLLPWDVHVRLVQPHKHPQQQQSMGKKSQRYRKHGDRLALKIFVGFEYECSRGHRFMMCGPDRVLRGGADIERDTSSKVVNNNMPLYFPCPCRAQTTYLAQLMRIHVVTPKAPVNIILDPKMRVGKYIFTLGCPTLPRLSQSAYWILRLPYVYQGDNVIITPPERLEPDDNLAAGCLLAGMFGIAETDTSETSQQAITPLTFTRL